MRDFYRQTTRWNRPSRPLVLPLAPDNYATVVIGLRRRLGLSQGQFAERLGAANKAVVYRWESRKRRPSPLFWPRIEELARRRGSSVESSAATLPR